ncbi:MAG TPA: RNA polymerase sigma factor [Bellilinea sp.]|nr:RNA polymerase sigma factor [Bellilinea sp.]
MATRTNQEWLTDFQSDGMQHEAAILDLRDIIMRGLPHALSKWLSPDDPRFQTLIEEVAQDTVMRVTARLDTFEGRSLFTTWVYTIAVRIALTEVRKVRWQEVSLDELTAGRENSDEPREMPDLSSGVQITIEKKEMMATLGRILNSSLTEKQRTALMAVAMHGMPLEEVARRMGSERNAIYKLLHDARLKLKSNLEKEGFSAAEILAAFEPE